jgi:hypothetical protein
MIADFLFGVLTGVFALICAVGMANRIVCGGWLKFPWN